MSIKDLLTEDMKQAMKDKESGKLRLSVIRMARANIKNIEIDEKRELNDDEVLAVLVKEVKMRQDSLEEFAKAGREELVEQPICSYHSCRVSASRRRHHSQAIWLFQYMA